jgi:hypothetical protein
MPFVSEPCSVLRANVTVITDLEGQIVRIICPEYEEVTGTCLVKRGARAAGPLSLFLERVSEETLDSGTTRCELR